MESGKWKEGGVAEQTNTSHLSVASDTLSPSLMLFSVGKRYWVNENKEPRLRAQWAVHSGENIISLGPHCHCRTTLTAALLPLLSQSGKHSSQGRCWRRKGQKCCHISNPTVARSDKGSADGSASRIMSREKGIFFESCVVHTIHNITGCDTRTI